jgi:hypothetical protein
LEDQKNRGKEKENHQLYELARAKGITVKGDEGETNCRDIKVDCQYLEKDRDAAGDSRLPLGEGSCWLGSHGCSSGSPLEREGVEGWSLRVEDEHLREMYL